MRAVAQEREAVLLTPKERQEAKVLWREIFFEDSDAFTDYYFQEKMDDNTGYGIWEGKELISMLYLTPYEGMLRASGAKDGFLRIPLFYIVGVGTKKEYRHQGCMDLLLKKALHDLQKEGHPFAFLMPASPSIYLPYQFRYIYDRPEFLLPLERCERQDQDAEHMGQNAADNAGAERMRTEDAAAVAAFAEAQLREQYQFFLHRDTAYYRRQKKESLAQNGDIYVWKENGRIKGFYLYAQEESVYIQEAVAEPEFAYRRGIGLSEKRKPIIMARITDVQAMLACMRLKQAAPFETLTVLLAVSDELLEGNNATFLWTVGKKDSTIAMVEKRGQIRCGIADLTEFVFGRKRAEECFDGMDRAEQKAALISKLDFVDVIADSFLNEIV